jgi:hypothetical protein
MKQIRKKRLKSGQRRRWLRKPVTRAHSTKKGEKGYDRDKFKKELSKALEEILKYERKKQDH